MARILLLTTYFPPDQHIGATRWGRLGKYLTLLGHEFFVVAEDRALFVPQGGKVSFEPSEVRRVPYRSAKHMLARLSRLSKSLGKRPEGAEQSPGHQGTGMAAPRKRAAWPRQLMYALSDALDFPHSSTRWVRPALRVACAVIKQHDIDLIVATHPSMGTLLAARKLHLQFGLPWIADMRDPWSTDPVPPYLSPPLVRPFVAYLERRTLPAAAATVAVNRQTAQMLLVDPNRVAVIPNSFDPDDFVDDTSHPPSVPPRGGEALSVASSPQIVIAFIGSIGPFDGYKLFIDGWKTLNPRQDCPIRLHYYGRSYQALYEYAASRGLEPSLIVNRGLVPQIDAFAALQSADVLLVPGCTDPALEYHLGGKVLEYLGAGRPIVAVCGPVSSLRDLIEETGAGVVLTSPSAVSSWLESLIRNPAEVVSTMLAQRRVDKIRRYSTPYTAQEYDALISRVL